MKFAGTAVALVALLTVADASNPSPQLRATEGKLSKEDEAYWARFMQDASMSGGGGGDCDVEVSVDCTTAVGNSPCDEIVGPDEMCSGGSCIERLTLSYQDCLCGESDNNQGSAFDCDDKGEDIPEGGTALVVCANADRVYCDCEVSEGGTIVLEAPDGECLPDDLTCTISNAANDEESQELTFDASGGTSLDLKDKFGHLTVEGCENEDGDSKDCLVEVDYEYTAVNNGDIPATVIEFESDCNGDVTNLIEGIPSDDPSLVIQPQNTLLVTEPSVIDSCSETCIEKEVKVVIEAEDGTICDDDQDLEFCIEPPPPTPSPPTPDCGIEPLLSCETADNGDPCDEIVPPPETCSGGECIERLSLSYRDCDCDESDNDQGDNFECEDFDEQIPEGGIALVLCVSAERVFCNCTVREGEVIVVEGVDGGCLPDDLTCTISNAENGEVSQNITFITAGDDSVPLSLKDKFGHLTIEACSDPTGDIGGNCLVDVTYRYGFENTGSEDLTLTTFERECDGETRDLIADAPPNVPLVVAPGVVFSVNEPAVIDACTVDCIDKKLTIETEDPAGDECTTVEDEEICIDS